MNKLAIGAGRLTGGRFFRVLPLAAGGGPEIKLFVDVIDVVDTGGAVEALGGTGSVGVEGGFEGEGSISIEFPDGKAVFAFAAFAAAINSFGVIYPSLFGVDSAAAGFR